MNANEIYWCSLRNVGNKRISSLIYLISTFQNVYIGKCTSLALINKYVCQQGNKYERKTYSFLKTSNLFPGFYIFASGLQKLLVGQVESLTNS